MKVKLHWNLWLIEVNIVGIIKKTLIQFIFLSKYLQLFLSASTFILSDDHYENERDSSKKIRLKTWENNDE